MANYDVMSIFSHNVYRILQERGLTHADMAEMLDIERTHFSRALRGENSPRLKFVENVANALEVDIRELFEPIPEKVYS